MKLIYSSYVDVAVNNTLTGQLLRLLQGPCLQDHSQIVLIISHHAPGGTAKQLLATAAFIKLSRDIRAVAMTLLLLHSPNEPYLYYLIATVALSNGFHTICKKQNQRLVMMLNMFDFAVTPRSEENRLITAWMALYDDWGTPWNYLHLWNHCTASFSLQAFQSDVVFLCWCFVWVRPIHEGKSRAKKA